MSIGIVLVALALSGAVPVIAQSTAKKTSPPRTAWGKPDLQGVWDFRTITPLERPQNLAGQEFLSEKDAAKLEQAAENRNEELLQRPADGARVGLLAAQPRRLFEEPLSKHKIRPFHVYSLWHPVGWLNRS